MYLPILVIINRVPLHIPEGWSIFCNNINVSNAFNWECFGAVTRKITIENGFMEDDPEYDMNKDEMVIQCFPDILQPVTMKLKPISSFTYCGGFWLDRIYICRVFITRYNWIKALRAVTYPRRIFECEQKELECKWKLGRDHPYLWVTSRNEWVKQDYMKYEKNG
jgi:hypothetical protein